VSRKLREAAMERMRATEARIPPASQPLLTIPARTLAGTHYVPTLTLGGRDPVSGPLAMAVIPAGWETPETTWTSYPAVHPA
jgi:hypothetical protein